jgi:Ca2+-binding RTX toxin-like protein
MSATIDPATMLGSGSSVTMNGSTFQVGLQSSPSALKSVGSGLPSGVSVAGNAITVKQAGAVLSDYDFRGYSISVQADNVTIKNSLLNAVSYHTIYQGPSNSGLKVLGNTFDGQKANGTINGDMVLSENAATISNNEFFNLPADGVNITGGVIEHNYFSGASYQTGAHADAISIHRTVAPVTIRENYIDFINRPDAPQGTNAALKIVSHFGPINDVTVTGNVLRGGGYTIYAGPDKYSVSNVKITGNEVSLGAFGPLISGDHGSNFSYSNDGVITVSNKAASAAPGPQKATSAAVAVGPAPALGPSKVGNTIIGSNQQDAITGTDGKDVIKLKGGADIVQAHGGNDVITGGAGKDWMAGQGGNDAFVYESVKDSRPGENYRDEILDWGFGKDRIDLHLIDANTKVLGNQAFSWIGSKAFSGHAGDLRFAPDHDGVVVSGDVNGDRKADFQIEVHGTKVLLAAADFYL